MLPMTLGANIGTTFTALLAALAVPTHDSLQIAFCGAAVLRGKIYEHVEMIGNVHPDLGMAWLSGIWAGETWWLRSGKWLDVWWLPWNLGRNQEAMLAFGIPRDIGRIALFGRFLTAIWNWQNWETNNWMYGDLTTKHRDWTREHAGI